MAEIEALLEAKLGALEARVGALESKNCSLEVKVRIFSIFGFVSLYFEMIFILQFIWCFQLIFGYCLLLM